MCNNTVLEPNAKVRSLSRHLPWVTPLCPYRASVHPPASDYLYPLDLTSTSATAEQTLRFLSCDKDVWTS